MTIFITALIAGSIAFMMGYILGVMLKEGRLQDDNQVLKGKIDYLQNQLLDKSDPTGLHNAIELLHDEIKSHKKVIAIKETLNSHYREMVNNHRAQIDSLKDALAEKEMDAQDMAEEQGDVDAFCNARIDQLNKED